MQEICTSGSVGAPGFKSRGHPTARSGLRYGAAMRQISGSNTDLRRKEPRDDQYRRS